CGRDSAERSGDAPAGAAREDRRLRRGLRGAPPDLCHRARHATAGHAGGTCDRARRGTERLPLLVVRRGGREERAVPVEDEEPRSTAAGAMTMFITKSHLSRRTFFRGVGATVALPFLDS